MMADIESADFKRAAKQYPCESCGTTIQKGETYLYERENWYETGAVHRTCSACAQKREAK